MNIRGYYLTLVQRVALVVVGNYSWTPTYMFGSFTVGKALRSM